MTERVPTLYEWAGGATAFERLTEVFYAKVRDDDLLEPVFRGMDRSHPKHVALWLAEVFGGPARYTDERGGYPHMLAKHRNRALTEQQRRRWVDLICDAGDAAGARQIAAGSCAGAQGARAPVGLGRGASVHGVAVLPRGSYGPPG